MLTHKLRAENMRVRVTITYSHSKHEGNTTHLYQTSQKY